MLLWKLGDVLRGVAQCDVERSGTALAVNVGEWSLDHDETGNCERVFG
jgi:hypothetical protein